MQSSIEKWRTIPEFPSYVISNKGRVANKSGVMLKIKDGNVRLHRKGFSSRRVVLKLKNEIWQLSLK